MQIQQNKEKVAESSRYLKWRNSYLPLFISLFTILLVTVRQGVPKLENNSSWVSVELSRLLINTWWDYIEVYK